MKNKKQMRTLKLHPNGMLTYWDKDDIKGSIKFNLSTEVGMVSGKDNQWYIISTEEGTKNSRKYEFEELVGYEGISESWIEEIIK